MFELSTSGMKCLVYREDSISKTHDGGLKEMRSDRKEVLMFPSERSDRCCVCLIDMYFEIMSVNIQES